MFWHEVFEKSSWLSLIGHLMIHWCHQWKLFCLIFVECVCKKFTLQSVLSAASLARSFAVFALKDFKIHDQLEKIHRLCYLRFFCLNSWFDEKICRFSLENSNHSFEVGLHSLFLCILYQYASNRTAWCKACKMWKEKMCNWVRGYW